MTSPVTHSAGEVEALKGLIGWFGESSRKLADEYQRLERRVARLDKELERKNRDLESSLREREAARGHLLAVLESLKAGVLVLDRTLTPTLVNRPLRELLGRVSAERVGKLLGEKLSQCLRAGGADFLPLECERTVRGAQGAAVPVHLTVSEVKLGDVRDGGYVMVVQDVSRLRRLEAEAARSRRLAALGEMAATIAHEVRSPLGGIELYASLLKEEGTGKAARLAAEILKAAQRLGATSARLLSFAADPAVNAEPLPVAVLLQEIAEMAVPLSSGGAWPLSTDVEAELPPLRGDRRLLAQALFNLIANAKEAMPAGGTIGIKVRRAPLSSVNGRVHRDVAISVVDDGPGIAAKDQERVFDPFFTTKPTGTGLGLALTQKIVCAHGGSIELSSEPGRGSRFTVFLPVADGEETTIAHEGEESAAAHCYC